MKIVVPVKRVLDAYVSIRVKSDHSGVDTANVKTAINPFCEIALEAALQLKESGAADDILAVCIGPEAAEAQMRTALAMGADRALLLVCDEELEPLAIARVLSRVVTAEDAGMVLCGKQSIDGDHNQTGQMLAAMLGWPQATFVSELAVADGRAEVAREVDGGLEDLSVALPAVFTVDLRLNEPRYPSLPNIMKARQKPLQKTPLAELGVDTAARLELCSVQPPPGRAAGVMVADVGELMDKLRDEAGVL